MIDVRLLCLMDLSRREGEKKECFYHLPMTALSTMIEKIQERELRVKGKTTMHCKKLRRKTVSVSWLLLIRRKHRLKIVLNRFKITMRLSETITFYLKHKKE